MSHRITADWMTLMGQASSTANTYFEDAMRTVKHWLEKEGDPKRVPIMERMSMAMRLAELAERDFRASSFGIAAQNLMGELENIASQLGGD